MGEIITLQGELLTGILGIEKQAQFSNPAWPLGTEIFTESFRHLELAQSLIQAELPATVSPTAMAAQRGTEHRVQAVQNLFWHETCTSFLQQSRMVLAVETADYSQISSYPKEMIQRQ